MLKGGLFDPYYCRGSIKARFKKATKGFDLINEPECFYRTFQNKVKKNMGIFTNVPWVQKHFEPCFEILCALDLPFILIVQQNIFKTTYFQKQKHNIKNKEQLRLFSCRQQMTFTTKVGAKEYSVRKDICLLTYFPSETWYEKAIKYISLGDLAEIRFY